MKMILPVLIFFCVIAGFEWGNCAIVFAAPFIESPFNQFPLLHSADLVSVLKPFPVIAPRAYLVADLDSGEIISEKNSKTKLPIASLTKLMTAAVATENIGLQKTIAIEKSMLEPYGYSPYLGLGKKFSLGELLYPILIESSNDAAQAASCFLGKGQMINMMNEKARSLYMNSTSYNDVHGLDPNNISTVADLFYLARYISKNHPELLEITKGENTGGIGISPFAGMKNKNLVYNFPNFVGGKTGYIPESNYNGLFIFKISQADASAKRIAIIILGAPHLAVGSGNLKKDVTLTLDWLKNASGTRLPRLAVKP